MKKISNIFILTVILASSLMGGYMFVCRFLHLTNGFQYDELYSVATATPAVGLASIWKDMLLQDINLPLFNILFYGWNLLFPITPFYAHLFSALLGALAVLVAIKLAPKSWPKLQVFILAALMSGNFILVAYGTNVRSYSLSVLLATCFTLLALRLIEQIQQYHCPNWKNWLVFFVAGFLGAYSHYFCAAVFFIAALVVFLYACFYRCGRAWSFWGTAVVFALWLPWALFALGVMGGADPTASGATDWWYHTPFMLATWGIFIFLFGPSWILYGLVIFFTIAGVSAISTFKWKLFKQAEIILPLAQVVLLCAVLALVGMRFNLWMDRYFLPLLPSMLILLASLLYHLQSRHKIFLVLLPVLLFGWIQFYWNMDYVRAREYTGLQEAFDYLTGPQGPQQVLVERQNVGYPSKALDVMLAYYVPKDSPLKIMTLSPENASMAWESSPKIPILMMLCSQVHLIYTSIEMRLEEDGRPRLFGTDTCLFTAHAMPPRNKKK